VYPDCIPLPARVRVLQIVMQWHLIRCVDPVYPPEAFAKHLEGIVVIKVTIDKEGVVYKAEDESGPPELMPAAIEAIKQWKYQPYLLGGEPMKSRLRRRWASPCKCLRGGSPANPNRAPLPTSLSRLSVNNRPASTNCAYSRRVRGRCCSRKTWHLRRASVFCRDSRVGCRCRRSLDSCCA
jgi:TonB family protein